MANNVGHRSTDFTQLQEQIPFGGTHSYGVTFEPHCFHRFWLGEYGPMHIVCMYGGKNCSNYAENIGGAPYGILCDERGVSMDLCIPDRWLSWGFLVNGVASSQNDHLGHKLRTYKNHNYFLISVSFLILWKSCRKGA
jgi:hypothetical protein